MLRKICYNYRWKGGRVVDGTGLENQRGKPPQVRILSLPPKWVSKSLLLISHFEGRAWIHILSLPPVLFFRNFTGPIQLGIDAPRVNVVNNLLFFSPIF